ncbi:MAG: LacI family DNA-binding transcriptional regulator [Chthoniobacteraceae bacterium]
MTHRPTLQQVADAAGVGKSTASLALRDDTRLLPETRRRVQEAAAQLGYRANATVAALMAQLRSHRTPKYQATLGLLNVSTERGKLKEYRTFTDWVTGCHRRAEQLGYGLDEFWLHEPRIDAERLIGILESRGIRGLVIMGVLDDGVLPAAFDRIWKSFACVVVGLGRMQPLLHSASNDQYGTAREAFTAARALGYRRPGLVIEAKVDQNVEQRFSAGFFVGQNTLPRADRVPVCDFDRTDSAAFEAWYRKHEPDVIICIHEQIKTWLAAMKVRVPRDVGLIHLDRTTGMTEWAGMDQHNDYVGVAAIDLIIGQLHRNEAGVPSFAKSTMVASEWTPGSTARQQRPR